MKKTITALLVLSAVSMPAAALLIDDFSTPQDMVTISGTSNPDYDASTATGAGILGGERELFIILDENTSNNSSASLFVEGGELFLNNDSKILTTSSITWDGSSDNGATPTPQSGSSFSSNLSDLDIVKLGVDTDGLNDTNGTGVDFTEGGLLDSLLIDVDFADAGFDFYINTWWDDGTQSNSALFELEASPSSPIGPNYDEILNFDDLLFGQTDWTDITAFQVVIKGQNINGALDIRIDQAETSGEIPEPATIGIFGLALTGMGIMHRRRKNLQG